MEKLSHPFSSTMSVGAIMRRYVVGVLLVMIAYCVVLSISLKLVRTMPPGLLRILVAITPVVPIAIVLVMAFRAVSRFDEMWRRIWLEAAALAAGTTALLAVASIFLENVGMPRLSGAWTFGSLLWLCSVYFAIISWRRSR